MAVLVWWILPVATTILGICWAAWVRRTPRARSDAETVRGYARFRATLAGPVPQIVPPTAHDAVVGNSRQAPTV